MFADQHPIPLIDEALFAPKRCAAVLNDPGDHVRRLLRTLGGALEQDRCSSTLCIGPHASVGAFRTL